MSNNTKRHKGISQELAPTNSDNQETPPQWSDLPETVVIQIFQCLEDVDRVSMAMVTRKWHQVFCSPRLWRTRTFNFIHERLTGYNPSIMLTNGECAIEYLKRFGSCLTNVEIIIDRLYTGIPEFSQEFKILSEALDNASLKRIRFDIFYSNIPKDEEHLIRIIKNQKSLEEFDVYNTSFDLQSSHNLLRCLAETCARTLKHIYLPFILEDASLYQCGSVITELKQFTNISRINVDMTFLSDDLLTFWSRECPSLKLIEIWVTPQKVNYSGSLISNKAWKALAKTHSHLLADIYCIEDERESKVSLDILSPEMPLKALTWDTYLRFRTELELTSFLHRIAHYRKTLRHLYLKFFVDFDDLNTALVMNIVSQYSKLLPHKLVKSSYVHDKNVWIIKEVKEVALV